MAEQGTPAGAVLRELYASEINVRFVQAMGRELNDHGADAVAHTEHAQRQAWREAARRNV